MQVSPTPQTFPQSQQSSQPQYQNQIPQSQAFSQFPQPQQWAPFNPTQQLNPSQTLPIQFNNPFAQPAPSTQMPQSSQIDPQAFYAGFMDYIRLGGFQNNPMPMNMHPAQMQQMQQMFMAQQMNPSYFGAPQFGAGQTMSMPMSPSHPHPPAMNGQPANVTSLSAPVGPHSLSPQVCEPSISRRSPLPETPPPPTPSVKSKGKERAISGSTKRKRTPLKDSYDSSEGESISAFATPPRKISQDRHRKTGEIFRSPSGEQLLFYVQVDLPGRAGTVQPIRVSDILRIPYC